LLLLFLLLLLCYAFSYTLVVSFFVTSLLNTVAINSCHFLAHEDTGMMSTLFIGPPDWVFRWEEHQPLFIGLVMGMLLAGVLILVLMPRPKSGEEAYQAVTMNEVKSKAMD
jgi:hypothetical protein